MGFKDFALHEEIRRAMAELDFPANKQRIVSAAQDADISSDAVTMLQHLPEKDYADIEEVIQATKQPA